MVSKASEDLPEPDTPVTTVSLSTGMEKETFFRLLTRAPRTMIASWPMSGNTRRGPRLTPWPFGEPDMITRNACGDETQAGMLRRRKGFYCRLILTRLI